MSADLSSKDRLMTLDFLRGFSVFLMIIFHLCFDLNHFDYIDIKIYSGAFWHYFRWLIVNLFIFTAGYSISIVHKKKILWPKALKRSGLLLVLSMMITVATYFLFPYSWVYFGILHFFAVATVMVLPLVYFPKVALILAALLGLGYYFDFLGTHFIYLWLQPLLHLPQYPEDIVPILPWIIPMLIGMYVGYYRALPEIKVLQKCKTVLFMGRHSLAVYMIHQPILFGSFMILEWF